MLSFLWSLGSFVLAIGVLVAFHEFGHFWVARRLGIRVLRFSIGFGRPLWRRVGRDGVEYVIAALPLGGYVKMLDEREGEVAAADLPRAFNRQPVWSRIAVVSAGPAANFLLAAALYWLVFVLGSPGLKPVVDEPAPESRAAAAGLQRGDEILAVNEIPVPTFQILRGELIERALDSESLQLEVRNPAGVVRQVTLALSGIRVDPIYLFQDLGVRPFQPEIPALLAQVIPGGAAEAAGLKAGDRLLDYDGTQISSWGSWAAWVRAHPGEIVTLGYDRAGVRQSVNVIVGSEVVDGESIGRIGARVDVPAGLWDNLMTEYRLDAVDAAPAAIAQTLRMSGLTLKLLWRMVLGDVSVKNVSGPIQIAQVAGYTASIGLVSFLNFVAIVSVSLFVLNLLPVPVLDGGHLLYYGVEAVKGSPLSEQAQVFGQKVGLVLIVALMGLAIYNDILSLIH